MSEVVIFHSSDTSICVAAAYSHSSRPDNLLLDHFSELITMTQDQRPPGIVKHITPHYITIYFVFKFVIQVHAAWGLTRIIFFELLSNINIYLLD